MNERKDSSGRPELRIVVDDETGKNVIGFDADVPLAAVFAAILATCADDIKRAPLVMRVITATEAGLVKVPAKRAGKMDPALRARTECPAVPGIAPAGELGAMLSILSDKIADAGAK